MKKSYSDKKEDKEIKLLPEVEEAKRVSEVLKKIETMDESRKDAKLRWADNYERQMFYRADDSDVNSTGRSTLRIPMETAFVESKTADEADTLPFSKTIALNPEYSEFAEIFQKIFDYVQYSVLNINETLIRLYLKQKNTLGDGILKIYWKKDERYIKRIVDTKKNGDVVTKDELVTFYDDIKVDVVDIRNFLIDPIVFYPDKTIDDANYCAFTYVYEYDSFEKLFVKENGYKNIDKVPEGGTTTDSTYVIYTDKETVAQNFESIVEVIEYWDILDDEFITIANGVEIRRTPIPYMNPYTKKKFLPIAHFIGHMCSTGFYNFSEIDLIKDLCEERETMRNINLDAAKSYTHPWLVVGGLNSIDTDDFVSGINSILDLNGGDINQIKQLSMSGNTGLPFNLEGANMNDSITITGHNVTGVLGEPGETATNTLKKSESQIKRTRFGNKYNELYGFRRLYMLMKNLILQYYDKKKLKSVYGEDGVRLYEYYSNLEKTLDSDYNIIVISNNQIPASTEIQKKRYQEMLGTLSAIPIDPNTGTIPEIFKAPVRKILESMDIPEKDIESSLLTAEKNETGMSEEEMIALESAKEAGLDVNGLEQQGGKKFKGAAPVKRSIGEGNQAQMQSNIQNIIAS